MNFPVPKGRPFRSLGLYRSGGKHAAPRGSVHWPSRPAAGKAAHQAAHAAPVPSQADPAHETAAGQDATTSETQAPLTESAIA